MNKGEVKTGQSIDSVKSEILNPILVKHILEILKLGEDFSFIDIGTGDATFFLALVESIIKAGYHPHSLAFVDNDEQIFPSLFNMQRIILK